MTKPVITLTQSITESIHNLFDVKRASSIIETLDHMLHGYILCDDEKFPIEKEDLSDALITINELSKFLKDIETKYEESKKPSPLSVTLNVA